MKIVLIYLLIINAASLLVMVIDKGLAKKGSFRVPESSLFMLAILGGSVGSIVGMYLVRHKTKHVSFTLGMPLILLAQMILIYFLFLRK